MAHFCAISLEAISVLSWRQLTVKRTNQLGEILFL